MPVWAHNPKLVYSPHDATWVMYHIGDGREAGRAINCSGTAGMPSSRSYRAITGSAPFQIHYATNLSGPWISLDVDGPGEPAYFAGRAAAAESTGYGAASTLFTSYPGVDNVAIRPSPPPTGGIWLFEQAQHGNGKTFVSFGNFTRNDARGGVLAWDACGGPPLLFDNGHPIEAVNIGSRVGALQVVGNASVLAGSPCALRYPTPDVDLAGPYTAAHGKIAVGAETNYLEVPSTTPGNHTGYYRVGVTQDAAGCRGACEVQPDCTSYTWDNRRIDDGTQRKGSPAGGEGDCYVRTDYLWWPNGSSHVNVNVVSGRPWQFDGDNPAPLLDATSGNVTVLYRTDSRGGSWQPSSPRMASLIGAATAPSWRGPYTMAGPYGGPISNEDYPWDENEDPFLWRSSRGYHALFHANTCVCPKLNSAPALARCDPPRVHRAFSLHKHTRVRPPPCTHTGTTVPHWQTH